MAAIAATAVVTARCSNLIAAHSTNGKVMKASGSRLVETIFWKTNQVTNERDEASAAASIHLRGLRRGRERSRHARINGAITSMPDASPSNHVHAFVASSE